MKDSKAGIPEAVESGNLKVSSPAKGPEVADSKKRETSVFDPNKGTFVEGLQLMLELFNEGTSAEEITVLFNGNNRHIPLSFIGDVIGKTQNVVRDELNDSQQLEAKHRINLDIAIFELLLQRDFGSFDLIQEELENNDYYLRKSFIQEMLIYQEQWESETLRQNGSQIHYAHSKRPRKQ
ncbi:hypothetical protein MMC29_006853 [Sticta canariensis]|nr:hypothetical protein [Sticta canariensis]